VFLFFQGSPGLNSAIAGARGFAGEEGEELVVYKYVEFL